MKKLLYLLFALALFHTSWGQTRPTQTTRNPGYFYFPWGGVFDSLEANGPVNITPSSPNPLINEEILSIGNNLADYTVKFDNKAGDIYIGVSDNLRFGFQPFQAIGIQALGGPFYIGSQTTDTVVIGTGDQPNILINDQGSNIQHFTGGELRSELSTTSLSLFRYTDNGAAPKFILKKSRGSYQNPSMVFPGDVVGAYDVFGYNGRTSDFERAGAFWFDIDDTTGGLFSHVDIYGGTTDGNGLYRTATLGMGKSYFYHSNQIDTLLHIKDDEVKFNSRIVQESSAKPYFLTTSGNDAFQVQSLLGRGTFQLGGLNNNTNMTRNTLSGQFEFTSFLNGSGNLETSGFGNMYRGDGVTREGSIRFFTYGTSINSGNDIAKTTRFAITETGVSVFTNVNNLFSRLYDVIDERPDSTYALQVWSETVGGPGGLGGGFYAEGDSKFTDNLSVDGHIVVPKVKMVNSNGLRFETFNSTASYLDVKSNLNGVELKAVGFSQSSFTLKVDVDTAIYVSPGGNVSLKQDLSVAGNISANDGAFSGDVTVGSTLNAGSDLRADADIQLATTSWIYFGDKNTDGTWRMGISEGEFVHQFRESGTFVTKNTITP